MLESVTKVSSEIVVDSTKGNECRETILPHAVARLLHPLCEGKSDDDLVFMEADGAYMRQQSISKRHNGWFKQSLIASGLPLLTAPRPASRWRLRRHVVARGGMEHTETALHLIRSDEYARAEALHESAGAYGA